MSTLAIHGGEPVGFSDINRAANTMTFGAGSRLMSLLMNAYGQTITFADYEDSLESLANAAEEAEFGGELAAEALDRLHASLEPASAFLVNRPHFVEAPEIEIWGSGKVAFEWYASPHRIVNATIDRDGRLVYSALIGEERVGGVAFVAGKWPAELIRAIGKIRQ